MSEPQYRSGVLVKYVDHCGSDRHVARSAWVAHPGNGDEGEAGWRRVIRAMMKCRHGSPFEHGLMTVYAEAPAFVWWEWTRHTFMAVDAPDASFNLESARYRVLDGVFYKPAPDRAIREPAGFRPMRPELEPGSEADRKSIDVCFDHATCAAWRAYSSLVGVGISREVARSILPFGIYYAGYVSANPRTWLHFFSLRTRHDRAKYPSYPQAEIEAVAVECEEMFRSRWPWTWEAFTEFGRLAP